MLTSTHRDLGDRSSSNEAPPQTDETCKPLRRRSLESTVDSRELTVRLGTDEACAFRPSPDYNLTDIAVTVLESASQHSSGPIHARCSRVIALAALVREADLTGQLPPRSRCTSRVTGAMKTCNPLPFKAGERRFFVYRLQNLTQMDRTFASLDF